MAEGGEEGGGEGSEMVEAGGERGGGVMEEREAEDGMEADQGSRGKVGRGVRASKNNRKGNTLAGARPPS
jgi:hypothetical protein